MGLHLISVFHGKHSGFTVPSLLLVFPVSWLGQLVARAKVWGSGVVFFGWIEQLGFMASTAMPIFSLMHPLIICWAVVRCVVSADGSRRVIS